VLNDFRGAFGGLAWPETDVAHTDRTTLIRQLREGQYSRFKCQFGCSVTDWRAGRHGSLQAKATRTEPQAAAG
jgi:hypothetical protein